MAYKYGSMIGEDWKKEYEKVILSRKFAYASSLIGNASANPNDFNVKRAYGSVIDYISSIPIGDDAPNQAKRKVFLTRLDEVKIVLFGNPDDARVLLMYKKYGVIPDQERRGIKMVSTLANYPDLIGKLRDILIEAGDFATSGGLRITLHRRRKRGMGGIMERENIEDLKIEGIKDREYNPDGTTKKDVPTDGTTKKTDPESG